MGEGRSEKREKERKWNVYLLHTPALVFKELQNTKTIFDLDHVSQAPGSRATPQANQLQAQLDGTGPTPPGG